MSAVARSRSTMLSLRSMPDGKRRSYRASSARAPCASPAFRARRMRLEPAAPEERAWLRETLERIIVVGVALDTDGTLALALAGR